MNYLWMIWSVAMCVTNTTGGKYHWSRLFCIWVRTGGQGVAAVCVSSWSVWDVTFDQALFSVVVCLCTHCPAFLFPFYTLSPWRSPCSINRPHGWQCLPPCHHLLWKVTWTWGPNGIDHFPPIYTFVRWIILFPWQFTHSSRPNLSCIFIFFSMSSLLFSYVPRIQTTTLVN